MNGDLKPSGYDVDRDNQSEWLFICLFVCRVSLINSVAQLGPQAFEEPEVMMYETLGVRTRRNQPKLTACLAPLVVH